MIEKKVVQMTEPHRNEEEGGPQTPQGYHHIFGRSMAYVMSLILLITQYKPDFLFFN
jgi:hypothetical protein